MWHRKATQPEWLTCSRPYSFYHDFIANYWAGGPSEASAAPIHRLCTLARKMGVSSLIIDDGLERADITEEIGHLEELTGGDGEVTASVVTFLSRARPRDRDVRNLFPNEIIGQFCIVTFPCSGVPRSYIYEAVMRLPCRGPRNDQLLNNHVSISSSIEIDVRGSKHVLPASYFCQQNGVSSICAHSAARMLIRTVKGVHVPTATLNELWSYDPDTRSVDRVKLEDALRRYGFQPVLYDLERGAGTFSENPSDNVWALLTLLADAGSPSLLMLSENGAADHVVPILGHTFNSDEWHPLGTVLHREGEETVSSGHLWIDHLLMHDDVLGPYFCLSRAGLFPGPDEAKLKPQLAMAMLPSGVSASPAAAESFAHHAISRVIKDVEESGLAEGKWWEHIRTLRERRVFRTTMIERDAYLAELRASTVKAANSRGVETILGWIEAALPDRMWMCELTVPNLFLANRAKLGELLIDPRSIPEDRDPMLRCLVGFRLPSMIAWRDGSQDGGSRIVGTRWIETGHIPIHAPHQHGNRW